MPHRVNAQSDIGTSKIASDAYDVDNIFLTDQGWVYRHAKQIDATGNITKYWDEILVAGFTQANPLAGPDEPPYTIDGVDNAPISETTYSANGGGSETYPSPTFETTGDTYVDVRYSDHIDDAGNPIDKVVTDGGGAPYP